MARRDFDAYDTPAPLATAIVKRILDRAAGRWASYPPNVLEPTAGGGVFVRAVRAEWPGAKIAAVDLDPARIDGLVSAGADNAIHADILDVPIAAIGQAGLIIGNPPYTVAEKILTHLLMGARPANDVHPVVVAMLLPVGFLASKERHTPADVIKRHPQEGIFHLFPLRYLAPIAGRPSFTDNGKTDRMEYAVFGWGEALPNGIDDAITWEK
jgi:hypothetical protein